MTEEKLAIRFPLRHYWKKRVSVRTAAIEICEVEGKYKVAKTIAIERFRRFNNSGSSLEDQPRSGQLLLTVNIEVLCASWWREQRPQTSIRSF